MGEAGNTHTRAVSRNHTLHYALTCHVQSIAFTVVSVAAFIARPRYKMAFLKTIGMMVETLQKGYTSTLNKEDWPVHSQWQ